MRARSRERFSAPRTTLRRRRSCSSKRWRNSRADSCSKNRDWSAGSMPAKCCAPSIPATSSTSWSNSKRRSPARIASPAPARSAGEETFPTDIAAQVDDDLTLLLPISRREAKRMSRSDLLAVIAAKEAITQASEPSPIARERAIVATGTSTGGLLEGEEYYFTRMVRGRRRAPASRVLQQPTSAPSDAVARAFKLGGGVLSNATACASAGAAIGMAADTLRSHHADVAIAGGSDALCRLTYSGFNVLQAVDPSPCAPFAAQRKGLTLGEGAAYLVLERWDDAIARGSTILAEFWCYGASCDAHHPTAPAEDGRGAEAAMRAAIAEARVSEVDYVNAHGTGTLLNDSAETKAIAAAVGVKIPVSSSKSYFG